MCIYHAVPQVVSIVTKIRILKQITTEIRAESRNVELYL